MPSQGTLQEHYLLPGCAKDDHSYQNALLPLFGVIDPFPARDAIEANESAGPKVLRVLLGRDDALTWALSPGGNAKGCCPSCQVHLTLLPVFSTRGRLDDSGPTAWGRGGGLGRVAVERPRPSGRR